MQGVKPVLGMCGLLALVAATPTLASPDQVAMNTVPHATVEAAQQTDSEAAIDKRANALIARMSLAQKVAQIMMPDISSITPADVEKYRFGAILNGGNSGPGGNDKAPASAYLKLANAFWKASTAPLPNDEPAIPVVWATDAVHGDNNIIGATLYPQNIGLGAANDPALVRKIGAATAREIAVTGLDWAFAPTVAVTTDARWGRTYESFSENPAIVSRLGAAMVEGLQGTEGTKDFLDQDHVLATAKHFLGDGGTGGVDKGDTRGPIKEILKIHGAPYWATIHAGVQTIMASFSSVNGVKMSGDRALLTGELRDKMHFTGLVVGDWNSYAFVPGCTLTDCPKALMAGLDMYMVPDNWRGLMKTTIKQVRDGTIPMARLDQAVRRILRVKLRYHIFQKPEPEKRKLAGKWSILGSPAHRALAREAVRKSLVLLKNDGVLPIRANARILVAGSEANSVPDQAGGWSISWQGGGDLTNADFPGSTSIYAGIAKAAHAAGGTATYSPKGTFKTRPDVAVVVFGEKPYAEYVGDRPDHALHNDEGLDLLRKFKAEHIPTVAVLISGRPLWMSRELATADAFVAAWLPGTEGEGVADVLVGNAKGQPRYDFTGKLPFHWPADCADNTRPLFPLGAGGSYAHPPRALHDLILKCKPVTDATKVLFDRALAPQVTAFSRASFTAPKTSLPHLTSEPGNPIVKITAFDVHAQEDARMIQWKSAGDVVFKLPGQVPTARHKLVVTYELQPGHAVKVGPDCASCDTQVTLTAAPKNDGWKTMHFPMHCLSNEPVDAMRMHGSKGTVLRLLSIRIVPDTKEETSCPTGFNPN